MLRRTQLYTSLRNGLIVGLPVNQGLNIKCSRVLCSEADAPEPPGQAPVNQVLPSIVAQAQWCVGGDPIESDPGEWSSETPFDLSYQWQVDAGGNWLDVAGETDAQLAPLQAGTYRICVTATNDAGSTTACSTTTAVAGVQPGNQAPPVVSPSPAELGQELTATTGTWSGTLPITYGYQWQIDQSGVWTDIGSETASSYTPDAAGTYRVVVNASNTCGDGEASTSGAVAVTAPPAPLAVLQDNTAAHAEQSSTDPLIVTLNGVTQGNTLLLVVAGDDEDTDIAPTSLTDPAGSTWSKIADHQVAAWTDADSCGCVVYRADDVDAGTQSITASGWAGMIGSVTLLEVASLGDLGVTSTAGEPNYRNRPVDMGVESTLNPDAATVLVLAANAVTFNAGTSGSTIADAAYDDHGGEPAGLSIATVVQSKVETFDGSTPATWECNATAGDRNVQGWASLMLVFGTGSEPTPPTPSGLSPLSATPIVPMAAPEVGQWEEESTFGLQVTRLTTPSDTPPSTRNRHDYSRRQVFNADKTRYMMLSSDGFWLLYDATDFTFIRRMSGMGGQAEGLWHPTDANTLYYRSGTAWYSKNVNTDVNTLLHDFEAEYPNATDVWTKGEGCMSADGLTLGLLASQYDEGSQTVTCLGLLAWNPTTDTIIGQLDAAEFGNAMPDHISASPNGDFIVPSWTSSSLGTRAYSRDFLTFTQLLNGSEHSDLAFGPLGEDYYVVANYSTGQIECVDMETGSKFNLLGLYPRAGSAYACHISGQAFDFPGWVLVSTYDDSAEYNSVSPDPTLEPPYRKLLLLELKPGGRKLNVTPTHQTAGGYFNEPQATWSRDGSLAVWASNMGVGTVPSSYVVQIPVDDL